MNSRKHKLAELSSCNIHYEFTRSSVGKLPIKWNKIKLRSIFSVQEASVYSPFKTSPLQIQLIKCIEIRTLVKTRLTLRKVFDNMFKIDTKVNQCVT